MKKFTLKILFIITLTALIFSFSIVASAAENPSDIAYEDTQFSDTGADSNPFQELYDFVLLNLDKLLSALTLIASLILAFAYKKGLLPFIKSTVSSITKSAKKLEGATNEAIVKTEETVNLLSDRFAYCEGSIESLAKSLEDISDKLLEIEKEGRYAEQLKNAMLTEVEMLYDIFMNSSLPQYSKDAVGEKISIMKKTISAGKDDE